MNHVIQVNLAGLPFTLDTDAHAELDEYLARLNGYFYGSPGQSEIMSDIEARIAELFTQNMRGRQIVHLGDVRAACATLGQPEAVADAAGVNERGDFTEPTHNHYRNPAPAMNGHSPYAPHPVPYARKSKRLMRDPERKVISGVCGGLSAYLGIDDPLYVRIAFAVAFFGFGFGLLPYIILWIVMPEARTAADRLAMRGEPINVDNLSRQVEYEAKRFGETVQDLGNDLQANGVKNADYKRAFRRYSGQGAATQTSARNSREQRARYSEEGYVK